MTTTHKNSTADKDHPAQTAAPAGKDKPAAEKDHSTSVPSEEDFKLAPVGSPQWVAGQPQDEAELKKVDDEAKAKRDAAAKATADQAKASKDAIPDTMKTSP